MEPVRRILWQCLLALCVLALSLVFAAPSPAGPALGDQEKMEQPDGTTFEARQRGDEWHNWRETADGYGIYQDRKKTWRYFLTPATDRKTKSRIAHANENSDPIVGMHDPVRLGIPKHLRPAPTTSTFLSMPSITNSAAPGNPPSGGEAVSRSTTTTYVAGTKNVLVIGVDYSDAIATSPVGSITSSVFTGGTYSSVAGFFDDVSYHNVSISAATETSGTANDGFIGWLRLPGNHPNPGTTVSNTNAQIAKDAIQAADTGGYINFANYDTNADGYIDPDELAIVVVVGGLESSVTVTTAPSVWAHTGTMDGVGDGVVSSGTKTIRWYSELGERHYVGNNNHPLTMGPIAHELGHLLFILPDLYDTDTSNGTGMGLSLYDLMAFGGWGALSSTPSSIITTWPGIRPTHLSAWSKEYLGWGGVTYLTSNPSVSMPKVDGNSNSIFRINPFNSSTEYFLVENRVLSGYDQGFQKGSSSTVKGGLAIYHVDTAKTTLWPGSNTVNADETSKGVDVEEQSNGVALDTPGATWVTSTYFWYLGESTAQVSFFDRTPAPSPNSKLKTGADTNVEVLPLTINQDVMTVSVCTGTVTYSLSSSGNIPADGGTATVTVTASGEQCGWLAYFTTNSYGFTFDSNSGTGTGTFVVRAPANATQTTHSATIKIQDKSVVVYQDGQPDYEPTISFTTKNGQAVNTPIESTYAQPANYNRDTPIQIYSSTDGSGQYAISNFTTTGYGPWTNQTGTLPYTQGTSYYVKARVMSSSQSATATSVTVQFGLSTFATFTVTTGDATPDPFSFVPVTDAALSTPYTTTQATITGLVVASPISITGGEYLMYNGTVPDSRGWLSSAATITNNYKVAVRQTSSSNPGTMTTALLTIGGVSAPFNVTTVPPDSVPDPVQFPDRDRSGNEYPFHLVHDDRERDKSPDQHLHYGRRI